MHVLVVDDEQDVRVLLELYLAGRGHDVTAVGTGAAARRELVDGTFDVLCLDLTLPDVEGPQLAQELRGAGLLPQDLVLVSGQRPATLASLAADLGGVPLAKPFTVADLDALFAGLGSVD